MRLMQCWSYHIETNHIETGVTNHIEIGTCTEISQLMYQSIDYFLYVWNTDLASFIFDTINSCVLKLNKKLQQHLKTPPRIFCFLYFSFSPFISIPIIQFFNTNSALYQKVDADFPKAIIWDKVLNNERRKFF